MFGMFLVVVLVIALLPLTVAFAVIGFIGVLVEDEIAARRRRRWLAAHPEDRW